MLELKKLVYVPILHAREGAAPQKEPSAIDEMWDGIAAKIMGLALPWDKTRIYQDGLPVCGEELKVAERLAESGSRNHQLILKLVAQGAQLEGTESMELLLREHDLLNVLLMKHSGAERAAAMAQYQAKSRDLLKMRDGFIFHRIKSAILQQDLVPLVFMGVMHRVDKLLEKDFLISHVIYRLPFSSVEAIYN